MPAPVDVTAIEGQWRVTSVDVYLSFADDGTWYVSYSRTSDTGFDFGTYEFDGRTLTLHSSEEATASRCTGRSGTYVTAFSLDGSEVEFASVDDPCRQRGREIGAGMVRTES